MRVEKQNKAFAYRVPIGDYNYLQCVLKLFLLYLDTIQKTLHVSSAKNMSKSAKSMLGFW